MSAPIHVIWLDLWNSEPICDRTVATMVESSAAKKVPIHRAPRMTNLAKASGSLNRAYPCTPIDERLAAISKRRSKEQTHRSGRRTGAIETLDAAASAFSSGMIAGTLKAEADGSRAMEMELCICWTSSPSSAAFCGSSGRRSSFMMLSVIFQTVRRVGARRRLRNLRSCHCSACLFPNSSAHPHSPYFTARCRLQYMVYTNA
jgi:hypothetical protein